MGSKPHIVRQETPAVFDLDARGPGATRFAPLEAPMAERQLLRFGKESLEPVETRYRQRERRLLPAPDPSPALPASAHPLEQSENQNCQHAPNAYHDVQIGCSESHWAPFQSIRGDAIRTSPGETVRPKVGSSR